MVPLKWEKISVVKIAQTIYTVMTFQAGISELVDMP
jgi:hypothetical protein